MDTLLDKNRKKIDVIGIPVDVFVYEDLEAKIKQMLADKKRHHIVFLSLRDIVMAKFRRELRTTIQRASLVVPTSSYICKGAKYLKRVHIPQKIHIFEFIIKLLGAIENNGKSVYLLGGKLDVLRITEANIKSSFPGLNIVGRYTGFFPKEMENNITTAIKKASPALVLADSGLPGKRYWITRNNSVFNPGISLWADNIFDVFAGKKPKPSKTAGGMLIERIGRFFRNPLRIFNAFIYILYFILLLYYKAKRI
ncbi:MAG: WecB/TagA/CpsF family glycosyltransferase [Spirochaetes bacterium]|nr:WecB/TagA/CpsF family glycosyltransferase [Spirochaetota bacterium]